ncbi:MAG: MBL fold metallo-hydrolase [Armatimonadota bacterium]
MSFHRFKLGNCEITALPAQPSEVVSATDLFPNVDPSEFKAEFDRKPQFFGANGNELRFAQTICAIRINEFLILVDTGIPYENVEAILLDSIKEAGLSPEDFTHVILTHRDMDHIGGTVLNGQIAFPKARFVIAQSEYEDYQSDSVRTHFPTYIGPLLSAGVLDVVLDDAEIVPGVRFILTPGHRSGASSVLVNNEFLLLADVWHCPSQVSNPDWHIKWDSDVHLASRTRREVIEMAEEKGWLVAAPHSPVFGLGWVVRDREEMIWKPMIS